MTTMGWTALYLGLGAIITGIIAELEPFSKRDEALIPLIIVAWPLLGVCLALAGAYGLGKRAARLCQKLTKKP